MKVIIPIAGRGTRVRPHTYAKPKPFLPLAGRLAIDYLLEPILRMKPEEIIIVHDLISKNDVKRILPKRYPHVKFQFALQVDPLGTGHAIYMAKDLVKEGDDILIVYSDEIFFKDLSCVKELTKNAEGIIFGIEVKDPEHYGVLAVENGKITAVVEKSKNPPSNLANRGVFYFKNGLEFISKYVKMVIDKGINDQGEYFLTDAFNFMIEDGKTLVAEKFDVILDTGTVDKLLKANAYLLDGKVVKGENVNLELSYLGKNVTVGDNTKLINCTVNNSIIGSNTVIEGLTIKDSVIGNNVYLRKNGNSYNIGDNCTIS
jgi:glucose-1-phosphate thymidylyltransferase